jgi:hypothetical protein
MKLGSGGRCVPFCEQHNVVGLGWEMVDPAILYKESRDKVSAHVKEVCTWYKTARDVGIAVGQLWRLSTSGIADGSSTQSSRYRSWTSMVPSKVGCSAHA